MVKHRGYFTTRFDSLCLNSLIIAIVKDVFPYEVLSSSVAAFVKQVVDHLTQFLTHEVDNVFF